MKYEIRKSLGLFIIAPVAIIALLLTLSCSNGENEATFKKIAQQTLDARTILFAFNEGDEGYTINSLNYNTTPELLKTLAASGYLKKQSEGKFKSINYILTEKGKTYLYNGGFSAGKGVIIKLGSPSYSKAEGFTGKYETAKVDCEYTYEAAPWTVEKEFSNIPQVQKYLAKTQKQFKTTFYFEEDNGKWNVSFLNSIND